MNMIHCLPKGAIRSLDGDIVASSGDYLVLIEQARAPHRLVLEKMTPSQQSLDDTVRRCSPFRHYTSWHTNAGKHHHSRSDPCNQRSSLEIQYMSVRNSPTAIASLESQVLVPIRFPQPYHLRMNQSVESRPKVCPFCLTVIQSRAMFKHASP